MNANQERMHKLAAYLTEHTTQARFYTEHTIIIVTEITLAPNTASMLIRYTEYDKGDYVISYPNEWRPSYADFLRDLMRRKAVTELEYLDLS